MTATQVFTLMLNGVARGAGSPVTFLLCCLAVLMWAATGTLFKDF